MINFFEGVQYTKQWTTNLYLDLKDNDIFQVEFSSGGTDKKYVVEATSAFNEEIHYKQAKVPDELLQYDWDIKVKAQTDYNKIKEGVIIVKSAKKPDDYTFTPTIEKEYKTVQSQINNLSDKYIGKLHSNKGKFNVPYVFMTDGFEYNTYQLLYEPISIYSFKNYAMNKIDNRNPNSFSEAKNAVRVRFMEHFVFRGRATSTSYDYLVKQIGNDNGIITEALDEQGESWKVNINGIEVLFIITPANLPEPYATNCPKTGIYLHSTLSGDEKNHIDELEIEMMGISFIDDSLLSSRVVKSRDIDKTLTADTKPADAKTVGDRLTALEARIAVLEK